MAMAAPIPHRPTLAELESWAGARGLLLRLQSGRPLGLLYSLRVAVAQRQPGGSLKLLGELKGWALPRQDGLRLDTLRIPGRAEGQAERGVGPLIAAAAFAWALEVTPCRRARILAIRDGDRQHRRLVRYFRRLGFTPLRELGAAPVDLPARLIWGGAGLLMEADCYVGLVRSVRLLPRP